MYVNNEGTDSPPKQKRNGEIKMKTLLIALERRTYVKKVDIFTTIELSSFVENKDQINYVIDEMFTSSTDMITVTEMQDNREQPLGRFTFVQKDGKVHIEYRPYYVPTETYAITRTVPFDTYENIQEELKWYIGTWL
jgi:hypothetical protein